MLHQTIARAADMLVVLLLLVGCASAAPTIRSPVAQRPPTAAPTESLPKPPAPQQTPLPGRPCPTWIHDSYQVTGPDAKLYPTWHPPIDETYACTFDHEHGDDPRTSVLFTEVGMPPFGYVNAVEGQRTEDHVGNKVFVVNDDTRGGSLFVKLHQGTHSPDAFVNNLHELQYHYRNADGRRLDMLILAAFGRSGELVVTCGTADRQVVQMGTATNDLGGTSGARMIPSAACYNNLHPPYEDWLSDNHIITADGREIAVLNPHFAVFNPARYFAPGLPRNLGRSVDRCRELTALLRAECQYLRDNPSVTWDSPSSPFRGNRRELYVNQNIIFNAAGPAIWYCDPYGRNARTTPFPGAVQQYIAPGRFNTPEPSLVFGAENAHDGPAVRSPN